MKYSSRFFLYAPLALFLLLAIGAGAGWWIEASRLSARLDAMNGHEAMPGVTVRFASKAVSGFPFNLDVVFQNVSVEVKTPHGPSSWRAEKFALHALTYGREQMIFEAAGRQSVSWTDSGDHKHTLPFETGELHASAIAGERGLSRVDVDCVGFGAPALTAGRAGVHVRVAPGERTLEIALGADSVHLSPPLASLFGTDIARVRVEAAASPAKAFEPLRGGHADWVSTAERWRSAKGVLDISSFEIAYERLSMMGKGRLGLDASHSVEGLLDFKIAGIDHLVALAERRHVEGGLDRGIAAALLERASKAGNNEAGLLGAVVAFHAGTVSVGDVPATTEEPLY